MIYNIDFDIAAIFVYIIVLICFFFKKGLKKKENIIYFELVIAGLISALFDVASAMAETMLPHSNLALKYILIMAYYLAHNFVPLGFVIYILYSFGMTHRISPSILNLLPMPFLLNVLLILTTPFTKYVFYLDASHNYMRGSMISWLYGVAAFYMITAVAVIIAYHEVISNLRLYAIIFCVIGSCAPAAVQIFMGNILLELFFQSLGMLGVMLAVENKDEILSAITNVYNRNSFINDVDTAIKTGLHFRVMTIKIPEMVYLNATFGLEKINAFMEQVANYLDEITPNVNLYDCENGRFSMLFFKDNEVLIEELINTLKARFEREWLSGGTRLVFPVQICFAEVPTKIPTLEHLMIFIDEPYHNKENRVEIVNTDEVSNYNHELEIEQVIRRGIINHSFQVYYQPLWKRETGKFNSAEALLRLYDPELGFIPPDEFIPVAEKNGSIFEIGLMVFEEVCKLFKNNDIAKLGIEYIEVNLSVVQCMDNRLVPSFKEILHKYDVSPSKINLEITESATVNNQKALMDTILELKEVGFTFSLDDYGTGYSNFAYMIDMPFDIIKLDKSILWKAMDEEKVMAILTNSIRMVKEMNMKITVEGVETEEQKRILEELGCDFMQGYFFSKPLESNLFLTIIERFNDDYSDGGF